MPVTQEEIDAFNAPATLDSTSTADEIMQDLSNQQAMLNPTGGNIMDEVALTGGIPDTNITAPSGDIFAEGDPLAEEKIDFTPEQESTLQNILGQAGQTVSGALSELAKIPGAIVDTVNETVDILGKKINVGKTLASAAINRIAGVPISLVFETTKSLLPERDPRQNALEEFYDVKDGTIQSGLMKGYNPQKRIDTINETLAKQGDSPSQELIDRRNALIDAKAREKDILDAVATGAPQEDIGAIPGDIGADTITGDLPGGGNIMDEFVPQGTESQAVRGIKGPPSQISGPQVTEEKPVINLDDLSEIGEDADYIGYSPEEKAAIAAGTKTPELGDLTDFIDIEANKSAMERYLEDTTGGDGGADTITSQPVTGVKGPPSQISGPQVTEEKPTVGTGSGGLGDYQVQASRPTKSLSTTKPGTGGGADSGGSSSSGGKIVCTMMNESYGFGSFRNKIWLKHSKGLAPEYQKGYHKIFLPFVRLSKKSFVVKKVLEHIAVHRTIDIRQESRGKVHLLGRVYRKILEPICYWVGKYAK